MKGNTTNYLHFYFVSVLVRTSKVTFGGSIEGCGNDMHGPYLGPDGFFYWCKGAFAPQKHELENGRTLKSNAAHIYRARPDGSQLEMVITGGMNNPVGLAFSETGERFLSGTFFDLSQPGRRDGILHAVYGGTYGRSLVYDSLA